MRCSRDRDLFVKPRILDGAGDLRRKQGEQPRVIFGEVADALAFDVHHADHTVLHDQRHRHFGTDVGMRCNVAGIG